MQGSFPHVLRTIWAVLLATAALIAAQPAGSAAQPADSKVGIAELERAMTLYYRAPSDVVSLLKLWERSRPPQNRAMVGFLAGIFAKDPAIIASVTRTPFEIPTQAMVVLALGLADREAEAKRAAIAWSWPANQVASIPKYPPLINAKADRPETFGTLWAASLATADARYVQPIYEYYEKVAAQPEIEVGDIVAVVLAKHRRDNTVMQSLSKKYPRETLVRVLYASSALWSLESNARQHKFVGTALDRYAKERPGTAAIKGLNEVRSALARPG